MNPRQPSRFLLSGVALFVSCLCLAGGAGARMESSEIIILPDAQRYCAISPEVNIFKAQTAWIRAQAKAENMVFVSQVGDITDGGTRAEWAFADEAMKLLDGVVPYSVTFGNHDGGAPNLFGPARYAGRPWYLGSSPDGLAHAQTFAASGITLLHINLPWDFKPAHLAWAQETLAAHPGKPTIISTHGYLEYTRLGRAKTGNDIWNALIEPNPQVFMTFCGHDWTSRHETGVTASGRHVIQIMSDYQEIVDGGSGFLQKVIFDPAKGQIRVKTYSPFLDVSMTDFYSDFTYAASFGANGISVGGEITAACRFWTGGGADGQWQTPGNWGGTAPVAGALPVFRNGIRPTSTNNFPAGTRFSGLVFDTGVSTAVVLDGNPIVLTGDIVNANASAGLATINFPITLAGDRQIHTGDRNMVITGSIGGKGSLTKTYGRNYLRGSADGGVNGGELQLAAVNTYQGPTTVIGGGLVLAVANSANPIASSPAIILYRNTALKVTGLAKGTLALAPGQVLKGDGCVIGNLAVPRRSHLAPGLTVPGCLNVDGDLTLAAASALTIRIGGRDAGAHDRMDVSGQVKLQGARLAVAAANGYVPQPGDAFIIINNQGADPVCGQLAMRRGFFWPTDKWLAEGAVVSANFLGSGQPARISYRGGDGNDVMIYVPAATPKAPFISQSPASLATAAGGAETFRVVAAGSPLCLYQWQASQDGGASWTDIPAAAGGTMAFYTTPATTLADNGRQYRCRVTNEAGSAVSAAATLAVCRFTNGKMVYLPFDGSLNAGPGTNRNATVFAGIPRYTDDGKFGKAASFANVSGGNPTDWVASLGNLDDLYANSFSFSVWVKSSLAKSDGALLGNKNWASGGNVGWVLSIMPGKNLNWTTAGGGRNDIGLAMVDGKWHHVAVVVNRADNQVRTYLDGKAVHARALAAKGQESLATQLPTLIGGSGTGGYSGTGDLDDLAFWPRPLSAAEVAAIHSCGIRGIPLGGILEALGRQ